MSWITVVLGKIGFRYATDVALIAAERAAERFINYAKTDSYTALYEQVLMFSQPSSLTGKEKMERVLASAANDVRLWGEYFIRGIVEQILDQIQGKGAEQDS